MSCSSSMTWARGKYWLMEDPETLELIDCFPNKQINKQTTLSTKQTLLTEEVVWNIWMASQPEGWYLWCLHHVGWKRLSSWSPVEDREEGIYEQGGRGKIMMEQSTETAEPSFWKLMSSRLTIVESPWNQTRPFIGGRQWWSLDYQRGTWQ